MDQSLDQPPTRLQLWDHLFAWHGTPQLLLLAAVSYLLSHRSALLTMAAKSEVEQYVHTEHCLDMQHFLNKMHELMSHAPTVEMFSKVALFIASKDKDKGGGGGGGGSGAGGNAGGGEGLSSVGLGSALNAVRWPIPEGSYPPLRGYPQFVMDFQEEQRRRVAAEVEEARHKEFLVEEVRRRTEELKLQEEDWAEHRGKVRASFVKLFDTEGGREGGRESSGAQRETEREKERERERERERFVC